MESKRFYKEALMVSCFVKRKTGNFFCNKAKEPKRTPEYTKLPNNVPLIKGIPATNAAIKPAKLLG